MELGKFTRVVALSTAIGLGGIILDGCGGQSGPPTIKQIESKGHYFQMRRPNGKEMECFEYGADGFNLAYGSVSWLGLTCDWSDK